LTASVYIRDMLEASRHESPSRFLAPQRFYKAPLVATSQADLYAPRGFEGAAKIGVTDQFLAHADQYHARYNAPSHFEVLIRRAFDRLSVDVESARVLDIGSGSGNTIIPMLKLAPRGQIVATDISPELLVILRDVVATRPGDASRLGLVCADACDDLYVDGAFDVVVGASILHHLVTPALAVENALRGLRKGGVAIFFEPFEQSYAIQTLAYREILQEDARRRAATTPPLTERGALAFLLSGAAARAAGASMPLRDTVGSLLSAAAARVAGTPSSDTSAPLPEGPRALFEALIFDYEVRASLVPGDARLPHLDDKWLFTSAFFEDLQRRCDLASVEIVSSGSRPKPVSTRAEVDLRLGRGLEPSSLPGWAWEILSYYDTRSSRAYLDGLLGECTVILTR